ncbi:adenosylcobinamide-phosphate synthase [Lipingzhangella halophila]|uniref:Cobalamin biosynthesis protein CobD n=1 Tax=Lipingzhangella halophila TaxID=1783352 RepID=A0A7W7RJV2_9ACTN|nr:cobalamin biosynthesis protein [Lipingzhangella halophila]MBB4933333.1 adenosylcobinamide-phosphate synthase [Lipingzhangella halophila]
MNTTRDPSPAWPAALGLVAGVALDSALPDPRRVHPVAAFGHTASALERRMHRDSRARGAAYAALAVTPVVALGVLAERGGPLRRAALTAATTWAVVGGDMLGREAGAIADALEAGDLAGARDRLPHLCGRDPSELDEKGIARATVESVAENTSDAVVAPLLWGGLLGVPGLAGYRAVNTLDAMVGHRSPRYERFGWAAARTDDLANWAPARLTAVLTALAAPAVAGDPARAWRARSRYGGRHPSPNAGQCEAAFAGALGVRLGGTNTYAGRTEHRPELGEGRHPEVRDIRRAVRLARVVAGSAAAVAASIALLTASEQRGRAPRAAARSTHLPLSAFGRRVRAERPGRAA